MWKCVQFFAHSLARSLSLCHTLTHSYIHTRARASHRLSCLLTPIPSITVALSNLLLSFSVSNNSGPLLWQQSSVQKQANIALATNHNLFVVRNLLSCLVKLIFSTVSFMMAVAKITKPYHGGRRLRSYRCCCDMVFGMVFYCVVWYGHCLLKWKEIFILEHFFVHRSVVFWWCCFCTVHIDYYFSCSLSLSRN